ncbi:hypothetical protein JTB14_005162 [Gonioctena quinquepunctata]|nr:hypothetical protein JTB14_005162 [Gonioctena quinquepunctata]
MCSVIRKMYMFGNKHQIIPSHGANECIERCSKIHKQCRKTWQEAGRLNKCGVISPRFDVPITHIEKWTNNLLPSRQFGYVVLTTSGGIMDHEEARRKHLGGKILGFFF